MATQHFHAQVKCAELYFARSVNEHNLPFAIADHFKIAAEFACTQTKTAALVTHALAPAVNEPAIEACQEQPFTILCDKAMPILRGKKYFGKMVRFWHNQFNKAVTPIPGCTSGEHCNSRNFVQGND